MVRVSGRERKFLTDQRAWTFVMSGRYPGWQEALAALPEPDRAQAQLYQKPFCEALDKVARLAARALATAPEPPGEQSDEDSIWQILTRQHVAYWMRDAETFAAVHSHSEDFRFEAWVKSGGATHRRGWQDFWAAFELDLLHFPERNPYLAYLARRSNEMLRVVGPVAWASYDIRHPVADLPYVNTLGVTQEVRILERDAEGWKIALTVTLDDQFGQNDAAIWEVDRDGRVLNTNAIARSVGAGDVTIRGGRLRLSGNANDERLREAIRSAGEVGHGIFSRYRARSMVYQPTETSPFRVLWIINQGSRIQVTVVDQPIFEARLETAISAYGLSPAQTALVTALLNGASLTAAAQAEGISHTTARTQLQRIFVKIGVRSQSGLIGALVAAMEHGPMD